MSSTKSFSLALVVLGIGWTVGYAQRPEPEFMLSIEAPVGETRIECVSGCQLIGARDVGVPSAGRMKTYTFSCTGSHRCKGSAGGWVARAASTGTLSQAMPPSTSLERTRER